MHIGRRGLLGIGAATALSWATSSCQATDDGGELVTTRPPVTTTPTVTAGPTGVPTAGATGRFAAAPAPGTMYYGASVPRGKPLGEWEHQLGSKLSLHRSFFTPDRNETVQLVRRCQFDLRAGRLPHVSIKAVGWTWAEIGEGQHDDWLTELLDGLEADAGPVFLTLHHEPENDAGPPGMAPADYVAMQKHLIAMAADRAPQVTIAPVLQHWTFDPLRKDDDGDPSQWLVEEAPVLGLDIYNAWSATNGKAWRSLGSKASEVMSYFDGVPLLIGEYGCRVDPANPGKAAAWLRDAAEFGLENGFVSMSYFNSHVNSPDGTWALEGETEEMFAELLAQDWVARI